ncbi:NUDIX domain-containing protein [Nakamurella sp. YIM 132087]|uniref:NUDIX domain-containing protein n=2 Tax=Nakamurella alba TaxID=2665158 RepID=A0A7K1FIQ7_9ACTN|nr:NUDIX domain-containing protein [Nakamurella alba]
MNPVAERCPREPRSGCGAAIVVDGSILLLRRRNDPEAGAWGVPGGKIDLFETVEQAVRREIAEEAGIELGALRLLCVVDQIDRDAGEHWIAPVLLARDITGEPRIMEPHKHSGLRWFPLGEPPAPLTVATRTALLHL